jgi:hypothetical protein
MKYVPKGATKKKAKKASHMGEFILIMGLKQTVDLGQVVGLTNTYGQITRMFTMHGNILK